MNDLGDDSRKRLSKAEVRRRIAAIMRLRNELQASLAREIALVENAPPYSGNVVSLAVERAKRKVKT